MHVALQIVLAKWFPSGLPVVTKYTKYTSARAKTGAKTGRILGNSGRHVPSLYTLTPPDTTRHAPDNVWYVGTSPVMIYRAMQLIQIFCAHGRTDGRRCSKRSSRT